MTVFKKRKKRLSSRKKRVLDPRTVIDYKDFEGLKRFVTDRGKIIPRRVSGASASQQREICQEVKRARYLSLLPFSIAHRSEKQFIVEMALAAASAALRPRREREPRREDSESDSFEDGDDSED